MTLREKLRYISEHHPQLYELLKQVLPALVSRPETATSGDIDHYNFWIDSLDEDEALPLYVPKLLKA